MKGIAKGLRVGAVSLGLVIASAIGAPRVTHAAGPASGCTLLHYTYTETNYDTPLTATVSASSCVVGTSTSRSTTGSGTITWVSPPNQTALICLPTDFTGLCEHVDLTLNVGGATMHPVFDIVMVRSLGNPDIIPSLQNTTFDFAQTGAMTFDSGEGAGWMTETCAYVPLSSENCVADGAFTWVQ